MSTTQTTQYLTRHLIVVCTYVCIIFIIHNRLPNRRTLQQLNNIRPLCRIGKLHHLRPQVSIFVKRSIRIQTPLGQVYLTAFRITVNTVYCICQWLYTRLLQSFRHLFIAYLYNLYTTAPRLFYHTARNFQFYHSGITHITITTKPYVWVLAVKRAYVIGGGLDLRGVESDKNIAQPVFFRLF